MTVMEAAARVPHLVSGRFSPKPPPTGQSPAGPPAESERFAFAASVGNTCRKPSCGRLLALTLVLAATPAFAQSTGDVAQARDLFRQGVEHLRAERWADACEVLKSSNALVETAPTHQNLAICSEELGRVLDQSEHLRAFLRLAGPEVDPARIAEVRTTLTALEPRVPSVVPTVDPPNADAELTINGVNVPREAWANARPVNPGSVVIRAVSDDFEDYLETFQVAEGQRLEIDVALRARPRVANDEPPTQTPIYLVTDERPHRDDERSGVHPALWIAIAAVLAAGVGLGIYFAVRDPGAASAEFPEGTPRFEALRFGR